MKKTLSDRIAFPSICLALLSLLVAAAPVGAGDEPLETRLEGIVSVAVADYLFPDKNGNMTGYSRTVYTVRVGEFEFVDLEGDPAILSKLKTGERVVLQGQREATKLFRTTQILSREAGPDMGYEKAFLGAQDLAVVPVQFPNLAFPTACQFDILDSIAFTSPQSLTAYWEEVSFDKLFFSDISKTFDVVTLNEDYVSGCDLNVWTSRANVILGSEINAYNRRVYTFPSALTAVCPFGLGQVGTEGLGVTLSWVTGCNSPDAYIHEVGHNFGLRHTWTDIEYGDTGDIMGFGGVGVRKVNGPHVDHLDWLPDGEPYFKTLSGIGDYTETLTALGRDYRTEPNPTQVLKVFAPSLGKDLYISYRDNHGMDSGLISSYRNKTHIHTERDITGTSQVRILSTNEAHMIGSDGITITQVNTNLPAGTATVRVVIEVPNDCEEDSPIVVVASANPTHARPGGTIDYTLEITNQDGITCLPVDFRLSAALPGPGWTADQLVEVTAASGQTVAPVFSVTSPPDVTGFNYDFSIITTVAADVEGEHTVNTPVTYRIDRLAPTEPCDLLMNAVTPNSLTMSWTESTDFHSGLSHYEVLRSFGNLDFAAIGESPTPEFVDTNSDAGDLLWYLLRAVDNAGNVSD